MILSKRLHTNDNIVLGGGCDRYLITKLVALVDLTLADTLHLRCMNTVDLVLGVLLLLE